MTEYVVDHILPVCLVLLCYWIIIMVLLGRQVVRGEIEDFEVGFGACLIKMVSKMSSAGAVSASLHFGSYCGSERQLLCCVMVLV